MLDCLFQVIQKSVRNIFVENNEVIGKKKEGEKKRNGSWLVENHWLLRKCNKISLDSERDTPTVSSHFAKSSKKIFRK